MVVLDRDWKREVGSGRGRYTGWDDAWIWGFVGRSLSVEFLNPQVERGGWEIFVAELADRIECCALLLTEAGRWTLEGKGGGN